MRRYLRENSGWNIHLDKAGSFILEVLKNKDFDHVVVLGSGWLLDFPIERILPFVKKITLVDIHFPPQIQRKIADFKEVECILADITGGYIQAVFNNLRKVKEVFHLPENINPPRIASKEKMLIISLNILNQLDILLVDYIREHSRSKEEDLSSLRKILQESHIKMLSEHPFVLITDYREILINTDGRVVGEKDLIFTELPSGGMEQEWEWEFDTHRLYHDHANTRMKVMAIFSPGSLL